MSIKKLVAIFFLPVILIVIIPIVIPILWAAFSPVIFTPVFMGVAGTMIPLAILSASLAISKSICEENWTFKRIIIAFVVAFFGSELAFLSLIAFMVSFSSYELTPFKLALYAVLFSPVSLILSFHGIGVIDLDSGSSSDHKSYDRYKVDDMVGAFDDWKDRWAQQQRYWEEYRRYQEEEQWRRNNDP
jgi:hypothetical protein